MKKNNLNFTMRVVKNGGEVERYETRSKRAFYTHIRSLNWKDGVKKVYLRVSYGKHLDNFGKLRNFYNDGWYDKKKDLLLAFRAFTEEGIV